MDEPIRLGIVGLGLMGRHHARVSTTLENVELVGGADPAGDVHRALTGRPVFKTLDELLGLGLDAAIVAVPSEEHEAVAVALASAGVHSLIEKPLANTLNAAVDIRDAFAGTDLVAAVGQVERYNPAMVALKRRLNRGELGRIISIRTRRAGPNPTRVRDVGVVADLATHDIDLALWLGGRLASLSAEVAHRLESPYEDLVEVIGRFEDGAVVSLSVNWLTPTKERSVSVLGERGAFVADLLSADLTFFSNAETPVEWEDMARLKGVSEGDMVRYALPKREPLRVQMERFCDAVMGVDDSQIVSLDDAVEVLRVVERILKEAAQ